MNEYQTKLAQKATEGYELNSDDEAAMKKINQSMLASEKIYIQRLRQLENDLNDKEIGESEGEDLDEKSSQALNFKVGVRNSNFTKSPLIISLSTNSLNTNSSKSHDFSDEEDELA